VRAVLASLLLAGAAGAATETGPTRIWAPPEGARAGQDLDLEGALDPEEGTVALWVRLPEAPPAGAVPLWEVPGRRYRLELARVQGGELLATELRARAGGADDPASPEDRDLLLLLLDPASTGEDPPARIGRRPARAGWVHLALRWTATPAGRRVQLLADLEPVAEHLAPWARFAEATDALRLGGSSPLEASGAWEPAPGLRARGLALTAAWLDDAVLAALRLRTHPGGGAP